MRWHPADKHDHHHQKRKEGRINDGGEGEFPSPTTPGSTNRGRRGGERDDELSRSTSSFLSRSRSSRRSHTPTPSFQRSASKRALGSLSIRRRSKTPTPSSSSSPVEIPTLSKLMSENRIMINGSGGGGSSTPRGSSELSRSTSRRSTTPIVFSRSTARRKPLVPVEMKLECTLEELCFGTVKKIKIKRDVINDAGIIVEEEEVLKINVKPGWTKGTKITFEGKGDEKPGFLPADIVLLIEEKRHPVFKRVGDDLELGVEVPLVKALTGCNISVPLLGGQRMTVRVDDIIHPESEKVIAGQGMPKSKEEGQRGVLRLKFLVKFPDQLSDQQRLEICTILEGMANILKRVVNILGPSW
ncbi:hypothetical protein Dimus_018096 [Dionaea muscipula]